MTLKDVLFFDTETTGVPDRKAKWSEDYNEFPHVVQLAWMHGCKAESHVIRPEGWEIPEETTAIHGISTEYAMEYGEPFAVVVDMFIQDCHEAGLICGHNVHFDTGIIKANILRELGREYYDANDVETALYKGKRIDTMRPTIKWVDARKANGCIKFPNLSDLYARCFPGETFPAHNAFEDVKAVARCLPVLIENGLVELKVKEYQEEQPNNPVSAFAKIADAASDAAKIAANAAKKFGAATETAGNGPIFDANQKDDKLPVQQEKSPQIEKSAEITGLSELLEENNF